VKNPWLYIFARIFVFGAPLALLLALGFNPFYSVAIATAVGLTASILWLNRYREEFAKRLYEKFNSKSKAETAEDSDN